MSRTYEIIELQDLIDETFGPIEFEVDRILYHDRPAMEPASCPVPDIWVEKTGSGKDMSWVPLADEWPNDDEPDECKGGRPWEFVTRSPAS